ncbi:DNA adenine methylase [Staphylococcus sp. GDX8P80P]|uniref:DNA adenine methylase n=1 Tax=Staphylococcus sp. GDX8P80P TaxID=2804104 RepID=UPI001FDA5825|nr:DNA adenine methylase [Staphylococcus sp. GDX8P80P]
MIKIRSPLFYVGDKYKLMPQLKKLFPENINNFYDVFAGGGSASINTDANFYHLNDLDNNIIDLHLLLYNNSENIEAFIKEMYGLINKYGLSHSEIYKNEEIENLKKIYKKTYYSIYNKNAYIELRNDYNNNLNTHLLYLLLVYGFNHMIRFNKSGNFNLPVGNVDWNKNVTIALKNYSEWVKKSKITYYNYDFEEFLNSKNFENEDFVYLDPPYLISLSDYNKYWGVKEEERLYKVLDNLNAEGIKWGLSNLVKHKGKENEILLNWAKKYKEYEVKSNYISRFDNSIKKDSREIYVTNF